MADSHDFRIGKFLLDTLTSGMYDDPLCVYREYLQNSADAIDEAVRANGGKRDGHEVRITIAPRTRTVTITDTGIGVGIRDAERVLLSVGESTKFGNRERGFRGIGRLGGVAYADSLVFTTKHAGETLESTNTWDCKLIRQLLSPTNRQSRELTLRDLIDRCVSIQQAKSEAPKGASFFRVEMTNVQCAKNVLMDIRRVKQYLAEVAPVPFDTMQFFFGEDLNEWLKGEVPSYNTYQVFVNDDLVRKPYGQTLALRGSKSDDIVDIRKFSIPDAEGTNIARGWLGVRKENLGQLSSGTGIDCIRVRVGNILLGNKHLLDECFQESRFNGYNVGEIHVSDPGLVPNARRDNFEDSDLKTAFFQGVERELGVPLTKSIRTKSKESSDKKPIEKAKEAILMVKRQTDRGFISDTQKREMVRDLRDNSWALEKVQNKRAVPEDLKKEAEKQIRQIDDLMSLAKEVEPDITGSLSTKFSIKERELIQLVLAM